MSATEFINNHPIPGESLTNSKDRKLPFEQAPQMVDVQEASEFIWGRLTSKEMLPQLFRLLRQDVPVQDLAQLVTFSGFSNGKWSQDLSMMLLEPTMYQIMHLANEGGVAYVFSKDMPDLNQAIQDEKMSPLESKLKDNLPAPGLMSDVEEDIEVGLEEELEGEV